MSDNAQFLRDQAEKCRWLARNSTDPAVVLRLHDMARDYDRHAATLDSEHGAG